MKIALFPLNLVVFPGENLNLHIFEPRYKQLIHDVAASDCSFGIPAFQEGLQMDYGTELSLENIVKSYEGGEMDISTLGKRVFKIKSFESCVEGKLYPGGEVEFIDDNQNPDFLMSQKIIDKIEELYNIMKIKKSLPDNSMEFSVYEFAHKIGLSFSQEKNLITTNSESDRQLFIFEHLEKMIPIVKQMEEMRIKIQMNGHFKNIIPPRV